MEVPVESLSPTLPPSASNSPGIYMYSMSWHPRDHQSSLFPCILQCKDHVLDPGTGIYIVGIGKGGMLGPWVSPGMYRQCTEGNSKLYHWIGMYMYTSNQ